MNWKRAEKISDIVLAIATLIMLATCVWFNID